MAIFPLKEGLRPYGVYFDVFKNGLDGHIPLKEGLRRVVFPVPVEVRGGLDGNILLKEGLRRL